MSLDAENLASEGGVNCRTSTASSSSDLQKDVFKLQQVHWKPQIFFWYFRHALL